MGIQFRSLGALFLRVGAQDKRGIQVLITGGISASRGHKTKGALNFDRWGTFFSGGGVHKTKVVLNFNNGAHFFLGGGHKIKAEILITGGTFSAYSISITGAPFHQGGGHKIKGEISITALGALFSEHYIIC